MSTTLTNAAKDNKLVVTLLLTLFATGGGLGGNLLATNGGSTNNTALTGRIATLEAVVEDNRDHVRTLNVSFADVNTRLSRIEGKIDTIIQLVEP